MEAHGLSFLGTIASLSAYRCASVGASVIFSDFNTAIAFTELARAVITRDENLLKIHFRASAHWRFISTDTDDGKFMRVSKFIDCVL